MNFVVYSDITFSRSLDLYPGSQGKQMNSWCVSYETEYRLIITQENCFLFTSVQNVFMAFQYICGCTQQNDSQNVKNRSTCTVIKYYILLRARVYGSPGNNCI